MNGKDYYTEYYKDHKRDLVLISSMIEEHNYDVVYDKVTGYFEKRLAKVSYYKCKKKGCQLCKEIKAAAEDIDEIPKARIISRGMAKASMYSIARLLGNGYSLDEVAYLYETTAEDLRNVVKNEIEHDTLPLSLVWRVFYDYFEIEFATIFEVVPFTPEDVLPHLTATNRSLGGYGKDYK